MRTFGSFRAGGEFFYGEVIGGEVRRLTRAPWAGIDAEGPDVPLEQLELGLAVAPGKLIAVGLNYADHIAEMKRMPLEPR